MKESVLYKPIKNFLQNKYGCFYSCEEAGKQGLGSVDVFGVCYLNSEKDRIETIGVDAKVNKTKVCAYFGQAKGYSIMLNKTYFASFQDGSIENSFNEVDIQVAKHLGIGIIKVYGISPDKLRCEEVLQAPTRKPLDCLLKDVLRIKKVFQCHGCTVFQH
jgi:hypothetical protein